MSRHFVVDELNLKRIEDSRLASREPEHSWMEKDEPSEGLCQAALRVPSNAEKRLATRLGRSTTTLKGESVRDRKLQMRQDCIASLFGHSVCISAVMALRKQLRPCITNLLQQRRRQALPSLTLMAQTGERDHRERVKCAGT